ncbi:molybdenum cofactor biosynthesis protein MoaE [Tomitella gaofuii]|uniref:molybdenum cofactor biosynthesis protein MoaE n=1 Tax=Tomitella gaofuii TaxID=2760083 RepID=UPI0015F9BD30|nr:molybdenum cofactor biosynthesis protein MoaE [Tomitella gaofuii]
MTAGTPGGADATGAVRRAAVCAERITLRGHEDLVGHDSAGAVVGFCGVVRDHDGGRGVLRLHYTAHPGAQDVLERVADGIAGAHPGIRAIAVSHRVGDLEIGDEALVAAVSADHRGAAFTACAALVEAVKEQIPVWKHQFFSDGTDEWVGCA